jgi:hypothetical protein
MRNLSLLLPNLALTVADALRAEGYELQAAQLPAKTIDRWTYDETVDAGYIYFIQDLPIPAGEIPAAKTVSFMNDEWFNVDLRASGELFGLELLSHKCVFTTLRGDSLQ